MKRALLLSGGVSPALNHARYLNDLAAFHRLLVRQHGFPASSIRVCLGSGGSFDFEDTGKLQPYLSARRPDVDESLEWLAELSTGDLMVVVASNHGDEDGLCLWGAGEFLKPADLEVTFGSCSADKVLVFGQCHAGIFAGMSIARAVTCCAARADEYSYASSRAGGDYDEFLFHFAGALAGVNPDRTTVDGTLPPPADITIAEVFAHASRKDERPEHPLIDDPSSLASSLRLSRP